MWRVNLPWCVKRISNPRLTPRIVVPSSHRPVRVRERDLYLNNVTVFAWLRYGDPRCSDPDIGVPSYGVAPAECALSRGWRALPSRAASSSARQK